jgi:diaminohydroxyphosphoribosylaminopyrimidine deaminase/5-amino-6-(5-phosphoribosylamino)uracil reductase
MAHLLRAEADAILVGRNTLEQDDPQLTCRLPGLEDRSPIRIVLASRPELSARSRMFQDDGPPVWVLCPPAVTKEPESGKVTLLPVPACASGKPDLKAAMKILAQRGITRLLVEGGPTIAKAFLDAGLAEEIVIIQGSGQTPCEGTMLPFLDRGLERLTESPDFIKADERRAGSDRIDIYRSREYWQG